MAKMKDSGIEWIGQIPDDWEMEKGKFHFTNKKIIPGIKSKDYNRLSLTLRGVVSRTKDDSDGLQPKDFNTYQLLQDNELVFKLIDLQNVSTSRIGLAHSTGLVSPAYIVLHAKDTMLPEYAEKFYLMMWHFEIFNALGNDGVRSNLNVGDLLNIKIPLPPLHEQQKIAAFLDEKCADIDDLYTNIKKEIEVLEEYKKSIITEAVTKGLDPDVKMKDSGVEWIGEIPDDWEVKRLKMCISQRDGGAWGKDANQNESDMICLRVADFDYVKFRFKDTEEELLTKRNYNGTNIDDIILQKNDIVIEKSGGGAKTPVGRTVVFDKDYKAVYANFCDRLRCSEIVLPWFIQYMFAAFYLNGCVWNYIKQTTGIQNLDLTTMLSSEKIALPTLVEQEKIVKFLDEKCAEIDDMIKLKKEQLEVLEQYKKSIIYEYVTGKSEVPDV